MTFGIGFSHPIYAGVVTDRRISTDGLPVSDQYDKAGIVEISNARMVYTLAGLAQWEDFDAATFTAMSLAQARYGAVPLNEVLGRFALLCTQKISGFGAIKGKRPTFTVLFSGYELVDGESISRFAMVSNWRKLDPVAGTENFYEPFDAFALSFQGTSSTRVLALSVGSGKFKEDSPAVRKLGQRLVNPKTAPALAVKAAIELIRESADNTIGEDCTSIVVPSDFSRDPDVSNHTTYATNEFRFPAFVQASHGPKGAGIAMNGLSGYDGDIDNPPVVSGPEPVSKRERCWCKSGKTFGECHGRGGVPTNEPPPGTTMSNHELDIRKYAPAAGGKPFDLPAYLFLPGTDLGNYKITNMRTGKVVQEGRTEGK